MREYDAVIFDLDGVICYTDEYHYQAWQAMADSIGVYFDREINNRLRGVSRMACMDIILERYKGRLSQAEKEELAGQKNELYKKLLVNMSPADLPEEVRCTLDKLRSRGYRLAIGSSSKNAPFILRQIGLGELFDAVSDGNNISRSKPDPEVFEKAALHTRTLTVGGCGRPLKKGESLCLDFGEHLVGTVRLKLGFAGSHPDAPIRF